MNKQATVQQLADIVSGDVIGDGERLVEGVASPHNATATDIIFIENPKFFDSLATTAAGAAIVPDGIELPAGMSGIRFPHPALGMARILDFLHPRERRFTEVSPQAYVSQGVEIASAVGIGPGAYIGNNVKIGSGTEIFPNTTIGDNVTIGENCLLYSGVHVYHDCVLGDRVALHSGVVIGSDGQVTNQPTVASLDNPSSHAIKHLSGI